jgi:prepilin-type N-terminal cleavage/methylation domain-containing protein
MLFMHVYERPVTRNNKGFTLIELLTVIAIIAILAAIIFPVFATVREKVRQGTGLSNMNRISQAITQFKLDNHRYPDVLFGYAVPGASMDQAQTQAKASGSAAFANTFPGLYPNYINDPSVFTDPDNPNHSNDSSSTAVVSVTVVTRSGSAVGTKSVNFYTADAFDSSPIISDPTNNTLNTATYAVRYQPFWVNISGGPTPPAGVSASDYNRQLIWPAHSADTYVTSTTWHVPHGKVLVLWDNGTAKVMDTSKFVGPGPDSTVGSAKFWTLSPNS